MWSSRSRTAPRTHSSVVAIGIAMLFLAGCEFTPVYAPGATGAALSGSVTVAPAEDELQFILVRELENRLGPAGSPRYSLTTALSTRSERVSITADQDTNRFNLVGRARWSLIEDGSGAEIATGRADAFSSYSATGTTVATEAAERDAYRRLMVILADKIIIDVTTRDLDMGVSAQ